MTLTLVPEAIETYAEEHSEPVAPLFADLKEETYQSMGAPQMQVGRLVGLCEIAKGHDWQQSYATLGVASIS